jgi:4-amino-4-deoxy-L-arabinose transferase-like glycosyltransferase
MLDFISRRGGVLLFIPLLLIIYFPVFLHLGYMPFRMWDESILGVNAIEMGQNHNYLVSYFYGYPDMFKCKPPLMLWNILLSAKILGFSELSLRLPSALAAAALCIYLFFVLKKISGNYLLGFFAVCILVACPGYIGLHVTRTGDFDSAWILFSTVFSLSLFMAVEAGEKKSQSRYLFLFFIFLTLGVLTKGVACLLQMLPGLLIYALARKKIKAMLGNPWFYGGLVIFIVFGLGYYFMRESINPGYIKAVWHNEIGSRFLGFGQGQDGPVTYYVKRLVTLQFAGYIFILPVALYTSLKFSAPVIKKIVWFAVINSTSFLILISIAAKKEPHYVAPVLPYLSIITASFFYVLYGFIVGWLNGIKLQSGVAVIAFLSVVSLLAKPYYDIVKTVCFPTDNWDGETAIHSRFFQQVARGQQNINPYKLVYGTKCEYGPATVLSCYREELAHKGINLWFARPEELAVHDKVVVFDSTSKQQIANEYKIDTLQHLDYCDADIIYIEDVKPQMGS